MTGLRLFLVGDDEVLDVLAEMTQHLDYVEVARLDEIPASLGSDDHLVLAYHERARGPRELARVLSASNPGFTTIVADEEGDSIGARAITCAADLISAIHSRR
jgi:hypothetical protein